MAGLDEPLRSIFLLLRIDHRTRKVHALRVAAAKPGLPERHRSPRSDAELKRQAPGTSEVIVRFLDAKGRTVAAWGLAGEPRSYHDAHHWEAHDHLTGGYVEHDVDNRRLHLDVPPTAELLAFSKKTVVRRGGKLGEVRVRTVHFTPKFRLSTKRPRRLPAGEQMLPWRTGSQRSKWSPVRARGRVGGSLGEPVPVGGEGHWSDSFNIVILGDGFIRTEQAMLVGRAQAVAQGFLGMSPYQRHRKNLTFTLVPAISPESGVSNCPYIGTRKKTYYGVSGNWNNSQVPGYFGTHFNERIHDAAAKAWPPERVHLTIMLVNTAAYGGRADLSQDLAYAAIQYPGKNFVDLVAHESAHAYANLDDEYEGVFVGPKSELRYNVGTEAELEAGRISWAHLAFPYERYADGRFRALHRYGDPINPNTNRPIMPPGFEGFLGAFWGSGDIDTHGDPPEPADDSAYTDPRGAGFYRPMAVCKMRWLNEPFCRVCDAVQSIAISKAVAEGKHQRRRTRRK